MANLHIQIDIHFHHGGEHEHFHDTPYQKIFQVVLTFHINKADEVYCPHHLKQLLEAEKKNK